MSRPGRLEFQANPIPWERYFSTQSKSPSRGASLGGAIEDGEHCNLSFSFPARRVEASVGGTPTAEACVHAEFLEEMR
jgi:hypothetical protein